MDTSLLSASLLVHDIGKLVGREKTIQTSFENEAESFYKEGNYFHAQIGAWWLNKVLHGKDKWQTIEQIILFHHNETSPPFLDEKTHSLIRLADWLASGERIEEEKQRVLT